jgi:hypothetical protein
LLVTAFGIAAFSITEPCRKLFARELAIFILVATRQQSREKPLPALWHFVFREDTVAVCIKLAEERGRFATRALAIILRGR